MQISNVYKSTCKCGTGSINSEVNNRKLEFLSQIIMRNAIFICRIHNLEHAHKCTFIYSLRTYPANIYMDKSDHKNRNNKNKRNIWLIKEVNDV